MTATYTAWNGREYPEPPPDGWYQASDGRWWAAGSGPGSPVADELDEPADPLPSPAPEPEPEAETETRPEMEPGRQETAAAERRRRPHRRRLLAAAAALAVVSVGAATLAFGGAPTGSGNETEAVLTAERTDTTGGGSSTGKSTTPSGGRANGAGTLTGGDSTVPSTSTTEPAGQDADVTSPGAEPVADVDHVALFRQLVDEAELDSELLADRDIDDLGRMLCLIAAAEDSDGFQNFQGQLATEKSQTSALTTDELTATIGAAIHAFCPGEVSRLGLDA